MLECGTRSLFAVATCGIFLVLGCTPVDEREPASLERIAAGESSELTQCFGKCPLGWHPTRYDCSEACGPCYSGNANQVHCEPDSGVNVFTQCGLSCPSGWHLTNYSCSAACVSVCANSNQSTCERDCDYRVGTHGKTWTATPGYSQYRFHEGWCSVGHGMPEGCWFGNYYYDQSLIRQSCAVLGSTGSCTDPDAWWDVTCNSLVDCVYDCNGQCLPVSC